MQSAVLFTVLAIGFYVNDVASVQIFDLKAFLKTLQQQLNKEQVPVNKNRHYSNEEEDSYGSLKRSDLKNLLSYSSNILGNNRQNKYSIKKDLSQYLEQRRPRHSEQFVPNDLTGLLSNMQQEESHFFSSSDSDQRDDGDNDVPNEYTKVYVVLNSEAIKNSNNKDRLSALLSGLLSSGPKGRSMQKKQRKRPEKRNQPLANTQYNKRGYKNANKLRIVKDADQRSESWLKELLLNARRSRNRDDMMDSMERDRPRGRGRGRSNGGGAMSMGRMGGGGGNARTAIPYLHHRGDIYEKEE